GYACALSLEGSTLVSSVEPPPDADTRCNPLVLPKRITPSRFQVPVADGGPESAASHNVRGAPPAISIRFSLLSGARNTSDLLSGDHVGEFPLSVPGKGRAARESNGRSHNDRAPVLSAAAKTT